MVGPQASGALDFRIGTPSGPVCWKPADRLLQIEAYAKIDIFS